jgi:hypothetical protein
MVKSLASGHDESEAKIVNMLEQFSLDDSRFQSLPDRDILNLCGFTFANLLKFSDAERLSLQTQTVAV